MRLGYKYLGRYREIAGVLVKYGFGYIVEKVNKEILGTKSVGSEDVNISKLSQSKRVRMAFQELGTTYIKIGQILSTRKDLFDDDMIKELSKLRDNVEPFDDEVAMTILISELGDKYDEFLEISSTSIASASIGQVYTAVLMDGSNVVIKVQRPDIEDDIKADLYILKKLSSSFDFLKEKLNIDIYDLILELEIQLLRELDYKFEAVNCIKMKNIFSDTDEVIIPTVYTDMSTKKVLVMEKIEGVPISEIDTMFLDDDERKRIMEIGVRSFFKQVMTCGFFHADPHPGNIFVLDSERIAYIDFGMVGVVDYSTLKQLNQLIIYLSAKRVDSVVRVLIELKAISDLSRIEALKRDLMYMIHYYFDMPLEQINISEVLNEVFRFLREYKVSLPSQMVMLGKTAITLEGTSRGICKDFSIRTIANAYIKYYKEEKLNLIKNARELKVDIDEYKDIMSKFPSQISKILRNIENNDISIGLGDIKSTSFERSIRIFTTQVSTSIMLAACIVGSSLILSSDNIQKSNIIKFVSIVGFLISFVIGIALVFMILMNNIKKGKKR